MALSKGRVNPLNVLDLRKIDRIPPHFGKMILKDSSRIKEIDNWIYTNLDSRYCIRKTQTVDSSTNKLILVHELGMEDPRELTMLSLGCPFLHR